MIVVMVWWLSAVFHVHRVSRADELEVDDA